MKLYASQYSKLYTLANKKLFFCNYHKNINEFKYVELGLIRPREGSRQFFECFFRHRHYSSMLCPRSCRFTTPDFPQVLCHPVHLPLIWISSLILFFPVRLHLTDAIRFADSGFANTGYVHTVRFRVPLQKTVIFGCSPAMSRISVFFLLASIFIVILFTGPHVIFFSIVFLNDIDF